MYHSILKYILPLLGCYFIISCNINTEQANTHTATKRPFEFYPALSIYSDKKLSYEDSLVFLDMWRASAETRFYGESEDSIQLSDSELYAILDSIYDFHLNYESIDLSISPDSSFTIYMLQGETIGAYSVAFFISRLKLLNSDTLIPVDINQIVDIYKLPDGKYLIIDEASIRQTSVFSENYYSALVISVQNNQVYFHPFQINLPSYNAHYTNESYNPDGKFIISQRHYHTGRQYLTYDSLQHTLSYQYSADWTLDSGYQYTGWFQYKNGEFIHQSEDKIQVYIPKNGEY